jgi:hypothetical protein
MEIRIAYHPNSETLVNKVSQFLKENGIKADVKMTPSVQNGTARLSTAKTQDSAPTVATTFGDSSFVHVENQPGY